MGRHFSLWDVLGGVGPGGAVLLWGLELFLNPPFVFLVSQGPEGMPGLPGFPVSTPVAAFPLGPEATLTLFLTPGMPLSIRMTKL